MGYAFFLEVSFAYCKKKPEERMNCFHVQGKYAYNTHKKRIHSNRLSFVLAKKQKKKEALGAINHKRKTFASTKKNFFPAQCLLIRIESSITPKNLCCSYESQERQKACVTLELVIPMSNPKSSEGCSSLGDLISCICKKLWAPPKPQRRRRRRPISKMTFFYFFP